METRILIVDDHPTNLQLLRDTLETEGYTIAIASDGEMALKLVQRNLPELIILDIVMPGLDGYEVCRRLKQQPATREIPVIFLTVREDADSLVQAFQVGGVDYITKPFEKTEVRARVKTHLKLYRLMQQLDEKNRELEQKNVALTEANRKLENEIARGQRLEQEKETAREQVKLLSHQQAQQWGVEGIIGQSDAVLKVLEDIRRLQKVDEMSVLITGESGTGKELVARAIHCGGTRADGPFIAVNCSAIPPDLAESEFFGHVKGAFTGANQNRRGYFELANGGTLFLDEIGDMPLPLQVKLLRVLEEGFVRPVGESREKAIDARVIAATNSDLQNRIASGEFRRDLYFRLARFTIAVPPLRQRPEDIPLLIDHFLALLSREMGLPATRLSPEALKTLSAYPFPGNVRELKNIIEYALIQSGGGCIEEQHLNLIGEKLLPTVAKPATLPPEAEALMIKGALLETKGDVAAAAQRLGLSPADIAPGLNGLADWVAPTQPAVYQTLTPEEKRIFDYVRQHGSINNTECRQLLKIPRHRAFYLLNQMTTANVLISKGAIRATRYYLPPSEPN